ncbi:MAG: radical SAM protein [Elusimicrobiota bacterium]|jgi:MoaA/NifB/PqqE/SkfB family radical SAM enzyme
MKTVFIHSGPESLAVELLSACLKRAGHETALVYSPGLFASFRLDLPRFERDDAARTAERALALRPDLVAFSVESDRFPWAARVAAALRERSRVPTVFGGVHPSAVPSRVLEAPGVDYVCVGEGEDALVELADALAKGGDGRAVAGLQGRDFRNPPRSPREDLDALPFPDKELFAREWPGFTDRAYSTVTGRGCSNACVYCSNSAARALHGKAARRRRRSPESVLRELEEAKTRYGFQRVSFCDDLFTEDAAWLRAFLPGYRTRVGLPFYCQVHPSHADEERVRLLSEGGCTVVNLGIQTVDEDYRRRVLRRPGSNAEVERALGLFAGTRIFLYTNFIFGLPGQSEAELEEIVRFCSRHPADFHDVNWLRYYPGTEAVALGLSCGALDAGAVAALEGGCEFRPYAHGGHARTPERSRLRNLVFLTSFLPGAWTRALLRPSLRRFVPTSDLRMPLIVLRVLWRKRFAGRSQPYPNASIADTLRWYAHYLLPRPESPLPRLRRALRTTLSALLMARSILGPRAALRFLRYGLRRRLLGRPVPGTAILAVTFDCPCSCGCCSSGVLKRFGTGAPLDTAGFLRRIDRLAELGAPRLHFTGGEPLLRADLPELAARASSHGMLVFVETNGLLLDEGMVRRLKAAGVSSVNVSLDSADAAEHDRLRGVPGCFAKATEALRICVRLGQPCMVSTYATRERIADGGVARLTALARELGCAGMRLLPPQASGAWLERGDVVLTAAEAEAAEAQLPLLFPVFNRTAQIRCPMKDGYKVFILPDGTLAPCEHLPFVFKDSRELDLGRLVERTRAVEMLAGDWDCMPRDPAFRARYLDGRVPKDGRPVEV